MFEFLSESFLVCVFEVIKVFFEFIFENYIFLVKIIFDDILVKYIIFFIFEELI